MSIQQTATNTFKVGLLNGAFNFTSDTFKLALYTGLATLGATTDTYTTANEVVASGYTAGGEALTVSVTPTVGASGGTTAYLSFSNVTWNAALTARGGLIYKVGGGNPTVCVLDFGADKTSTTTFQVQFPTANNADAIIRIS